MKSRVVCVGLVAAAALAAAACGKPPVRLATAACQWMFVGNDPNTPLRHLRCTIDGRFVRIDTTGVGSGGGPDETPYEGGGG